MNKSTTQLNKENEDEAVKNVEYDHLLSAAGEFGPYQFYLCLVSCPFYIFLAFIYYAQLFMTEVSPNHWCWVPELENLTDIERRSLSAPPDSNNPFGYSKCTAYDVNWSEVLNLGLKPNESWPTVPCQHGWEFNKSEIPYSTISSEMGWVCQRDGYQATAQSIYFIGSIVGGFLIGWISDRFGRVPALVISNIIGCVFGAVSIFSRNFIEFAIIRFFAGMAYDNCMAMIYLLALEYVAPKYRTVVANLPFAIFFTIGSASLPWITLACNDWKIMTLATSLPLFISVFALCLVPESPRWLLSRGRVEETIDKVIRIAHVNKKEISPKLIENFKNLATNKPKNDGGNMVEILKRPVLRRNFFCISLTFICSVIVFDTLVRILGEFNISFFLSFTLLSLTELPSLLIISFGLDLTGRKLLTVASLFSCCIFIVLIAVFGKGSVSLAFAVLARFAVNMPYNAVMQWAPEMLPTSVRGSGTAIVHICGYIATVISPFIAYLRTISTVLPLIVIAFLAGLGGLVSMTLPETAGKDMPSSFDAAEDLSKGQKCFELPCMSKKTDLNDTGHVNNSFELN